MEKEKNTSVRTRERKTIFLREKNRALRYFFEGSMRREVEKIRPPVVGVY